jgi:NAD+ synthase (glutamine-hydrolysing)
MQIALAQLNPTIGDVAGNAALVLDAIKQAHRDKAEILMTSELALVGYPPRDLLLREGVVAACENAVKTIAERAGDLYVIVGHPRRVTGGMRPFRNSVSICHRGKIIAVADKQLLPGYDVFDEDRYFEPGQRTCCIDINGRKAAILICEDLWRARDVMTERRYTVEPILEAKTQACQIVLSLNASPFVLGKWHKHIEQMRELAVELRVPVIAVNQAGANDDLIFDGRSLVVDGQGNVTHVLEGFQAHVQTVNVPDSTAEGRPSLGLDGPAHVKRWSDPCRELFHALVLAVRDYVHKTSHKQALIGLSGGVDSALTAVIASAALGPQNVYGVMMPSRFSSPGSISDSIDLAQRLRLGGCREISIKALHEAVEHTLTPALKGEYGGVCDENVQARLRAIILMALSNSMPATLLISTSNKSEIATGYSTLYGDMCGAVAVLGDVVKTRIYELSRWINSNHAACGFAQPPIPESSLTKPPSAELRPNQTDQDTLPPYDILDQIVERYIEREQSIDTIVADTGLDPGLVRRYTQMIDRAQFKRDQAPVIPKVTWRAFGRGRPMPIAMKMSTAHLKVNEASVMRGEDTSQDISEESCMMRRAVTKLDAPRVA